jgi:hypothetical protein
VPPIAKRANAGTEASVGAAGPRRLAVGIRFHRCASWRRARTHALYALVDS